MSAYRGCAFGSAKVQPPRLNATHSALLLLSLAKP
jgi:hypothetical protein